MVNALLAGVARLVAPQLPTHRSVSGKMHLVDVANVLFAEAKTSPFTLYNPAGMAAVVNGVTVSYMAGVEPFHERLVIARPGEAFDLACVEINYTPAFTVSAGYFGRPHRPFSVDEVPPSSADNSATFLRGFIEVLKSRSTDGTSNIPPTNNLIPSVYAGNFASFFLARFSEQTQTPSRA